MLPLPCDKIGWDVMSSAVSRSLTVLRKSWNDQVSSSRTVCQVITSAFSTATTSKRARLTAVGPLGSLGNTDSPCASPSGSYADGSPATTRFVTEPGRTDSIKKTTSIASDWPAAMGPNGQVRYQRLRRAQPPGLVVRKYANPLGTRSVSITLGDSDGPWLVTIIV